MADTDKTPVIAPPAPAGFKRLKLHSPLWRGVVGDVIRGAIVGAQPCELPDGSDRMSIMLQLLERPAPCVVIDGATTRLEELRPVAAVSPVDSQIVAVVVTGPALARLLAFAEQPDCQVVEIHALEPSELVVVPDAAGVIVADWADLPRGVVNPISGRRVRHVCFIGEKTIPRLSVDPIEIVRLEEVRRAARAAQAPAVP